MSREVIATRELEYAAKGKEVRCRLTVKVFKPIYCSKAKSHSIFRQEHQGVNLNLRV